MALPASYTQYINTVTTAALDALTRSPANLVTTGATVLMNEMASRGRIFMVNDCEKISHPLLYGTATVLRYDPTTGTGTERLDGTPAGSSLSMTAQDVLDKALFTMNAVTGNVNFPQNDPIGEIIATAPARVKAFVGDVLEQEENLFLRGEATGTGTEVECDPYTGDTTIIEGQNMSVLSLIRTGVATTAAQATTDKFANIAISDQAQWSPYVTGTASATGANIMTDLQSAINQTGKYGGVERPTHVLSTQAWWEKFVDLHRDNNRIVNELLSNLGTDQVWVPFANVRVGWSPFLSKDDEWDVTADVGVETPVLGLNLNSLRMNFARGGGVGSGLPGQSASMFSFLNDLQLSSTKSNYFRRINAKYNWSLDAGRRSFFHIEDFTL